MKRALRRSRSPQKSVSLFFEPFWHRILKLAQQVDYGTQRHVWVAGAEGLKRVYRPVAIQPQIGGSASNSDDRSHRSESPSLGRKGVAATVVRSFGRRRCTGDDKGEGDEEATDHNGSLCGGHPDRVIAPSGCPCRAARPLPYGARL
jgi:hypothetical protein